MRFSPLVSAVVLTLGIGYLAACSREQPATPSAPALNQTDISLGEAGLPGSKSFCNPTGEELGAPRISDPGGPSVPASINDFQTVYNTDFVTAGVGGLRNVGSGVIALAGVTGPVSAAYLYWNGPTESEDPAVNAALTVNGAPVVGDNIGFSHDNCWGYANTQSYRADVTTLVQATGNGNYNLAGLKTDPADLPGGANTNGASLVVFFDDGLFFNNRDVVIFDGNDSNIASSYDAAGWDVLLSGIVYFGGTANLQLHVADGQEYADADLLVNGIVLEPGPAVFQGNTVPSANNGPIDNGSLWDIRRWDVTAYLSPGPNSLNVTTGDYLDCLGLVVAIVDLPAGAAPGMEAFFTGGGGILVDGERATFGFNAGPRYPGDDPKGQLQYNDRVNEMKLHSTSIDLFNAGLDCASFSGECKVNGEPGYTFLARVCDNGEPGKDVDGFALVVWDGNGNVVYAAGDIIDQGNIQKHLLVDGMMGVAAGE